MMTSFVLSVLFLGLYVVYHSFGITVMFGDLNANGDLSLAEKKSIGNIRYLYYFILLTHILFSAIILPLVLTTFYTALTARIDLHKKLAKYTFPVWLYVTITGVIVYLMIEPWYQYVRLD